ncbi:MAG: D-xylose ABC transporter ATP-binding protein, partial [Meiothermus sp.]
MEPLSVGPQAPEAPPSTHPALEMLNISKAFPGVQALKDVSFVAYPGEIHALMGENGAGKSTLMKILAGAYSADSGEIRVFGQPVRINGPLDARKAGINLIYQELNLARNLTVAENIFMGVEPSRGGLVDRAAMSKAAGEVLRQLGASFTPETPLARLSIAEGQLVEIARALLFKSRVLVMDEPTAALSERETERLFELIRKLRAQGIAIVYISHRMAEVYALADKVTVLRDGQLIGTLEKKDISAERVVGMMVGRPVQDFYEHRTARQKG